MELFTIRNKQTIHRWGDLHDYGWKAPAKDDKPTKKSEKSENHGKACQLTSILVETSVDGSHSDYGSPFPEMGPKQSSVLKVLVDFSLTITILKATSMTSWKASHDIGY